MSYLKVTDKNKDRILNLLLLGSAILLLNGLIKPATRHNSDTPINSERRVLQIQPLQISQMPEYEEVTPINIDTAVVQQRNTEKSTPNANSTIPSNNSSTLKYKLVQPTPSYSYAVPSLNETLQKTLNNAKLRLF